MEDPPIVDDFDYQEWTPADWALLKEMEDRSV
jgi:hypothetical protein